jgi:hypothetical protein
MLKFTAHLLVAGSIALLPSCSKGSEKSGPSAQKSKASLSEHDKFRQWHDVCLQGDTNKIAEQIVKFEAALVRTPTNDLARAYLGSAYALKAKHSFFPPTKLSSLKKGKALMEAAVVGSPNKPRVRMVRAIAYYKVPRRFGTRVTSISDFEVLLDETKKTKSSLKANEKQAILYYASLAFAEESHKSAAEAKLLCHKIDPNSEYGKRTK